MTVVFKLMLTFRKKPLLALACLLWVSSNLCFVLYQSTAALHASDTNYVASGQTPGLLY